MNLQELVVEVFDHIRGMWRYRWWAAGATWLICALGWLFVFAMPDIYRASAKVFVDTNTLLRPLMQGLTAQRNPMDEVQAVSRALLSRPNLEQVAHDTDLSLRAETPEEMEALITRLQRRISVSGGRDQTFTIQYEDPSREKATEVVAAMLERFVENALGNQGEDTQMTERALASEIRAHEERLRAAEAALAAFKTENLGYMPGETGDYHSRLQNALAAVSRTEEQIRLLTARRDELRRQLEGEEPVFGIMPMTGGSSTGCSQATQIADAEAQLSALRVQYTDIHPRIVALEERIAVLQERCMEERRSVSFSGAAAQSSAQPLEANPVYQNLRMQLHATEVDLTQRQAELRLHEEAVAQLRRDVDKIAQVETELKQLNRDYDVVQARHQELLKRWEDLQAKNRLDPMTDQVQFRTIEPPFALADPVAPNRPILLAATLVFGLGCGVALAFALNQINPTFFNPRSLHRAVDFPVIGTVSMVLTPELARRRRAGALVWIGSYAALFFVALVMIVFAKQGSAFVRSILEGAFA